MRWSNPFPRRLYLRIWLAVVGGVAVLTLAVGWAWRITAEQNAQPFVPPSRELVLRNAKGDTVLSGAAIRQPGAPGEGAEFRIETDTGETFVLEMAPRPDRPGRAGRPGRPKQSDIPFWARPPYGFLWLLGLVGLAVALGVYPIIRRLTARLEVLQRSVKKFGEGDLSARVPADGEDEVADLARQFNAAAERVETLVKSHKSLLANASHELRSPLARIRMGLELMDMAPTLPAARGSLPPEGAHFALGRPSGETGDPASTTRAEINRNIAELDLLVDEILLASRLDAQQADIGTIESVDLTGLAAEECARVGAELHAAFDSPPVLVRGVPRLLRRLIRNLLENARRYGSGTIEVYLGSQAGDAVVRVCDNGPGVPESERERIFEPFYRLPGSSEREGGVGLGLALVKSIAERHGGRVICENDDRHGACFRFTMPLERF